MKFFLIIQEKLKFFFVLFLFLYFLVFPGNSQNVQLFALENHQNKMIIEELRLKVPAEFKDIWLEAEKNIWEPWLSRQKGFLGRQLFWDKQKEEALILVNWKSKKLWKSIPMSAVNEVQEKFEDNVQTNLNIKQNPFELIYEGELDKQG